MHTPKSTHLLLAALLLPALGWLATSLSDLGVEPAPAADPPQLAQASANERTPERLLTPGQRTFDMLTVAPSLTRTEIKTLMEQSDHMREVAAELDDVHDLGEALRRRVNEVEISEDEARAYFAQESDLFGERSFEESSWTIHQLLAIRKTREEFGL